MATNLKKSDYWFYYQHENVKNNYLANTNRKQILETWRTNPSVFDHVLINNYYSDFTFIFAVIICILIKVFVIRKKYFVNEKLNRHYEYEYHLINFMYATAVLCILFLQETKIWIFIIIWVLWYLGYLYRETFKNIYDQLREDKNLNIDVQQVEVEQEKELLAIREISDTDITKVDIWMHMWMWTKVVKYITWRYLKVWFEWFLSQLNKYLFFLIIAWFLYILFVVISMYYLWYNEYLIKIS